MNGVWLFLDTDHHHFSFYAPSTNKTNCRVIFEPMEIRYSVHVYVNLVAGRAG